MSIMSEKYINAPITKKDIDNLAAGDMVYISGTIYTARDAAHKRLYETILEGKDIPLELENNIIYYLGPSPAREGQVIGSAGPLFHETRTTPSCHPSGCAYRQL